MIVKVPLKKALSDVTTIIWSMATKRRMQQKSGHPLFHYNQLDTFFSAEFAAVRVCFSIRPSIDITLARLPGA